MGGTLHTMLCDVNRENAQRNVRHLWITRAARIRLALPSIVCYANHMTEMTKTIERVRRFFRDRPALNRTKFAEKANLHRNSFYGMDDKGWNPRVETIEKLLKAIEAHEGGEAKAQRKAHPKMAEACTA